MSEFQKKHPELAAELQGLVESGLGSEQIMEHFQEQDNKKLRAKEEAALPKENFPEEIKVVSRALAYRKPGVGDLRDIHELLNAAYRDEIQGPEAFRTSANGEAISLEEVASLYQQEAYEWIVMETTTDGSMIGACCFSTDGVSRRNGEVEGHLGSIRFFGILPKYRGLCLGQRLLTKIEDLIFTKAGCCRAMVCIPSARTSLLEWVERRYYNLVGSSAYPAMALRHTLTSASDAEPVELVRFIKSRPTAENDKNYSDADDKFGGKKTLRMAKPKAKPFDNITEENVKERVVYGDRPGSGPPVVVPGSTNRHLPPHWRQATQAVEQPDSTSTLPPIGEEEEGNAAALEKKTGSAAPPTVVKQSISSLLLSSSSSSSNPAAGGQGHSGQGQGQGQGQTSTGMVGGAEEGADDKKPLPRKSRMQVSALSVHEVDDIEADAGTMESILEGMD